VFVCNVINSRPYEARIGIGDDLLHSWNVVQTDLGVHRYRPLNMLLPSTCRVHRYTGATLFTIRGVIGFMQPACGETPVGGANEFGANSAGVTNSLMLTLANLFPSSTKLRDRGKIFPPTG
jgi:hypothetical protein